MQARRWSQVRCSCFNQPATASVLLSLRTGETGSLKTEDRMECMLGVNRVRERGRSPRTDAF